MKIFFSNTTFIAPSYLDLVHFSIDIYYGMTLSSSCIISSEELHLFVFIISILCLIQSHTNRVLNCIVFRFISFYFVLFSLLMTSNHTIFDKIYFR
jgi:hypothetical protein